jgi:photosystem II stability/assembly factor-like uncharacterized protein
MLSALTGAAAGLSAPSWASGALAPSTDKSSVDGGATSVNLVSPSGAATLTTEAAPSAPVGSASAPVGRGPSGTIFTATGSSSQGLLGDESPGGLSDQLALSPGFWANQNAQSAAGGTPIKPPPGFVAPQFIPITEPLRGLRTAQPALEAKPFLAPGDPPPAIPLNGNSWSLIGPAPVMGGQIAGAGAVSGRITGIATDPTNANIYYVAAAGGGVWKTTDAGATWTPLTDGQSTLFMGAIAVAPSSPSVLYAGTGEANNSGFDTFYGRGVLKSSDGGATWTLLNDNGAFDLGTIAKIAVSPTDANTLYVAVSNQGNNGNTNVVTGIYKSSDGGTTWTNTTSSIAGVAITDQFSDVVIDPTNPNNLFCAIGSPFGSAVDSVYTSTNAGGSWAVAGNFKSLDNGQGIGVIKMAISASNPKVLFASVGDPVTQGLDFVGKTTDGGTTWTKVSPGVDYLNTQEFYDQAVAIDPANPMIAYVGGQFNGTDSNGNFTNQVLETRDGGATWTDITIGADGNGVHPDHHAMAFDASGNLLDGNDGGVWRLANATPGSIQWADLNTNLATLQIVGIALHPTDPNTAYIGTQDNGTNKFTGAVAWTHVRDGDAGFVREDFTNPNTVYHTFARSAGSRSFIERSDDGGATWTDISTGINANDNSAFYPPYQMDPSNSSRLILGTDHVYETTTKGASWTIIGTPNSNGLNTKGTIDAIGLSKTAANTIYVGDSSGNVFVTLNDGASWTQRDIPGVTDHIQSLVVDPSNSMSVFAVRDRFGGGKVFHSADGGATWTNVTSNLPDLPAYDLAINTNTGVLYVGNDNGVFASNNGGASWATFGLGLPNAEVRELIFNPSLNVLAAGTHGRSAWEISTIPTAGGGGGGGGGGLGQEPEPDNTSDAATDFGRLIAGQTTTVTNEGIAPLPDGRNDYDWFRWELGQAGTFSATETTTALGNLEIHLFTLQGNTLVELANNTTPGVRSVTLSTAVSAGQVIFVEIKGHNSAPGVMDQGAYNLTASVA